MGLTHAPRGFRWKPKIRKSNSNRFLRTRGRGGVYLARARQSGRGTTVFQNLRREVLDGEGRAALDGAAIRRGQLSAMVKGATPSTCWTDSIGSPASAPRFVSSGAVLRAVAGDGGRNKNQAGERDGASTVDRRRDDEGVVSEFSNH